MNDQGVPVGLALLFVSHEYHNSALFHFEVVSEIVGDLRAPDNRMPCEQQSWGERPMRNRAHVITATRQRASVRVCTKVSHITRPLDYFI